MSTSRTRRTAEASGWCRSPRRPGVGDRGWVVAVDQNGGVPAPATALPTGSGWGRYPAAAQLNGDWVVACENDGFGGAEDIGILHVEVSGGTLQSVAQPKHGDASLADRSPSVVALGGKVGVYWERPDGLGGSDLVGVGLSVDGSLLCESEVLVADGAPGSLLGGVVAAAPDLPSSHALLVWEELGLAPPFDQDVKAHLVQPYGDGASADLGGGCGAGGTMSVGGLSIGNPAATFSLTGADVFASTALLNLQVSPGPTLVCGPCTGLLPGLIFPASVSLGQASLSLPVACNPAWVGATLDAQWIVLPTFSSPCPLFPNLSVSNLLQVTIGS